jgi:hypothetical protein
MELPIYKEIHHRGLPYDIQMLTLKYADPLSLVLSCSINLDISKRCSDLNFIQEYAKHSQYQLTFNDLLYIADFTETLCKKYPNVKFYTDWIYRFVFEYLLIKRLNKDYIPEKYGYLKYIHKTTNPIQMETRRSFLKTFFEEGDYTMAKLLLENGVDIKSIEAELWKKVILYFNEPMAKLLLQYGSISTTFGYKEYLVTEVISKFTIYLCAKDSYKYGINMIKMLIDAGANINAPCNNALIKTMQFRYELTQIRKFILENGGDILSQNLNGDTPLMIASSYGIIGNVKLILDEAVKKSILNEVINHKNKQGETAIDIAFDGAYRSEFSILHENSFDKIRKFFWKYFHEDRTELINLINSYKKKYNP